MRVHLIQQLHAFLPAPAALAGQDFSWKVERLRHAVDEYLQARSRAPAGVDPIIAVASIDTAPTMLAPVAVLVPVNGALDSSDGDCSNEDPEEEEENEELSDENENDSGQEDCEEQQSSSPPVLQLDYELGESLSPDDPSAPLLCEFRREYNSATIRLHDLESRTPYPATTATTELEQLRALLKRIQQARPPSADAPTAVHTIAAAPLALEFRKLEELVDDQIGVLCDRLELLDEPSSRAEVAKSFDLGDDDDDDGESDVAHQHASTDVDACDDAQRRSTVETTPHKEDCVHRGILFQCKVLAKGIVGFFVERATDFSRADRP